LGRAEGAGAAGVDVLDQDGPGGGAVDFHSSAPDPVVGREVQRVATAVRSAGEEEAAPGLMSLTRTVPAAVPSLFHSSAPCTPSSAEKIQQARRRR